MPRSILLACSKEGPWEKLCISTEQKQANLFSLLQEERKERKLVVASNCNWSPVKFDLSRQVRMHHRKVPTCDKKDSGRCGQSIWRYGNGTHDRKSEPFACGKARDRIPKRWNNRKQEKIEAKKRSLEVWKEKVLVEKLGIACKEDCCAEKKTDNNNLAEERRDCIATDKLAPCEEEYLDVNDNVGKDVDKKIQDEGDGPSGLMEEEWRWRTTGSTGGC